jgi:hypothetical protein
VDALDQVVNSGLDTAGEQEYQIDDVKYLTQVDNENVPLTSCFNTSNAMSMNYCLSLIGKTKTDIGCSSSMQLEDYIYEFMNGTETTEYIKEHSSTLGNLLTSEKRRIYFDIECFAFNHLMNPLGFQAKVYTNLSYDQICNYILEHKLPGVIGGNFKSVSTVGGHMNCLLGYNKIGLKEFIVHDPYGNALTGYKIRDGKYMHYGTKFYLEYNCYRVLLINKI